MPLSAAAAVAFACSHHHGRTAAVALCYCLCMLLPLHVAANMYAAVNMHVAAIACGGRSDHHGCAAFTTCLFFHTVFYSEPSGPVHISMVLCMFLTAHNSSSYLLMCWYLWIILVMWMFCPVYRFSACKHFVNRAQALLQAIGYSANGLVSAPSGLML